MLIEAQERVISEGYYPFGTKLALGIQLGDKRAGREKNVLHRPKDSSH